MKEKHIDSAVGAFFILFGVAILVAIKLGDMKFWAITLPGTGFMPTLAAIGIIICGLILLVKNLIFIRKISTDNEIFKLNKPELITFVVIIGFSLLILILSEYLGLIPSIAIAMALLIKLLGKESWRVSILTSLATSIIMYLVFSVFLNVPFPKGFLNF